MTEGFTITRTFDAPRELIWRAFTDPDEAPHWLHPREVVTPREHVRMDVQPGGTYEYVMIDPVGGRWPTGGTFHEVVEPERLVMTWRSPGEQDRDAPIITVTLAELPDARTEMTFRLDGIAADPAAEHGVYSGWAEALELLGERVATVHSPSGVDVRTSHALGR